MKSSWIELDLTVLEKNLDNLKAALDGSSEIIFVVKSNAYGHGMEAVSRCAWERGIKYFAVAHIEEAVSLREILPEAQILIVGVIDPSDAKIAATNNFVPVIVSQKHAELISTALAKSKSKSKLRCHAKIDTGMGRLGFLWKDVAVELKKVSSLPKIDLCGLCTHFASSDGSDLTFANVQAQRFQIVIDACDENGMADLFKHVSNSGGVVCNDKWDMDGVRPGIMLYGYGALSDGSRDIATEPILQWKTRIVQVRDVPSGFPVGYDSTYMTNQSTKIATIDIGYADGYSRLLSNKGTVLIGGKRVPVVGRVTMNLVSVDLGPDSDAQEGDEVVLIGRQGAESIWADEIAEICNTISYEILTSIKVS